MNETYTCGKCSRTHISAKNAAICAMQDAHDADVAALARAEARLQDIADQLADAEEEVASLRRERRNCERELAERQKRATVAA